MRLSQGAVVTDKLKDVKHRNNFVADVFFSKFQVALTARLKYDKI